MIPMDRKKVYITANFLLFTVGLFFVITSKTRITGAVVGMPGGSAEIGYATGLLLVIIAMVLFSGRKFFQKVLFSS